MCLKTTDCTKIAVYDFDSEWISFKEVIYTKKAVTFSYCKILAKNY